jgi:hypothetical protein
MTSDEIFVEMSALWETFKENHDRYQSKGIKKAAAIARKTSTEIKKLASTYRSTQLTESKQL